LEPNQNSASEDTIQAKLQRVAQEQAADVAEIQAKISHQLPTPHVQSRQVTIPKGEFSDLAKEPPN
jgi:hypothetical protein